MANKYIVLKTADGTTINKQFRVVEGGYQEQRLKAGVLKRSISGKIDMQSGSVLEIYSLVVKVRHTEEDEDYGTRADLLALYALNDPNHATTPDRLTMIDHYGNTKYAYMWEELVGQPLSVQIEGIYAWFHYQIILVIEPS